MRSIAHKYNWHFAPAGQGLIMHPGIANNTGELNPDGRAAQMRRVTDQFVAIKPGLEEFFAEGNPVFLTHFIDTVRFPGLVQRFHNKGRHARLEAISVRLEPTMLGFYKRKRESVESLFGTQPYEAALAHI